MQLNFRKGLKFNFKYQSISAKKEKKCSLYLLLFVIPYKKKAHLQEKCSMWIDFWICICVRHCTCCPFSQETAPKPFEGTSVISSGLATTICCAEILTYSYTDRRLVMGNSVVSIDLAHCATAKNQSGVPPVKHLECINVSKSYLTGVVVVIFSPFSGITLLITVSST